MLNDVLIFQGDKIYVKSPDVDAVYKELRTAVLDAKIPVTMPIGFKLTTPSNLSVTTAIDRNSSCLESMIAISINLSNIIMIGNHDNMTESDYMTGPVTTGNAHFISKGKHEVEAVFKDQLMFTAIEPLAIRLYLNKSTGYKSMAKNAAVIGASEFFPLNTMHSLNDYVSILPLTDKFIQVKYKNGMTPEIFEKLVKEA